MIDLINVSEIKDNQSKLDTERRRFPHSLAPQVAEAAKYSNGSLGKVQVGKG